MTTLKTASPVAIATHLRVCPHYQLTPAEHAELFHQAPQAGTSVVTSAFGLAFVKQHAAAILTCKGVAIGWYLKYANTNTTDGYGVIKATTRLSLYRLPM